MMDFTKQALKDQGFGGFLTFRELRNGKIDEIPLEDGVYVVLYENAAMPVFLDENYGGKFKGKDYTKDKDVLKGRWVDSAAVIYIGKSEGKKGIRERVWLFSEFGKGKPVSHRGGYPIWQLENSADLVVAWMSSSNEETAGNLEARLQREFREIYGRRPFANGREEKQT